MKNNTDSNKPMLEISGNKTSLDADAIIEARNSIVGILTATESRGDGVTIKALDVFAGMVRPGNISITGNTFTSGMSGSEGSPDILRA